MRTIIVVAAWFLAQVYARPDGYNYELPVGGGHIREVEPLIQKHIYVHVPPPDPEFHAPQQRVIPAPPAKKHYKIVFIKAPTYAPPAAPVIPELQQNQEKTLIYVLHKNPSDAPPIVIPTAKPTQPSKPEVYFIRYKTQKEVGYAGGPNEHQQLQQQQQQQQQHHQQQQQHRQHDYLLTGPGSTPHYIVSSTLAPHIISSTGRTYIRASRTPTPKFVTPPTPVKPSTPAESEGSSEEE